MKNREQIRARNAWLAIQRIEKSSTKGRGDEGGKVLSGFPALIINNGLLATLAFSKSKSKDGKKSGHEVVCDEIALHLADAEIRLIEDGKPDTDALLHKLISSDSDILRLCTSEALAYLNYLRRFEAS